MAEGDDKMMSPEEADDGEMAEGDDKMMSSEAMWGNIGFLMVAISHVAHPALDMFRYTSAATYWDVSDTTFGASATNWWKLYNQIAQYGTLSIGAILTITQLLSMFGIAAEVNVMLWGYATMLVGPLLGAAVSGIAMWGYDQAYQLCDTDSSAYADACIIMSDIEGDMLWHAVKEPPWVLPSWNPMKAGCRLNSWPSLRRPRRCGWKP